MSEFFSAVDAMPGDAFLAIVVAWTWLIAAIGGEW